MRKITNTKLVQLTNGQTLSLIQIIAANAAGIQDERLAAMLDTLSSQAQQLGQAMRLRNTASMTDKVESLSDAIDADYRTLRRLSGALAQSTIGPIQQLGSQLASIFGHYGDITRLNYEDKASRLSLFVSETDALNTDALSTIGLDHLLDGLKSGSEQFDAIYLERNNFRAYRKAKAADARQAVNQELIKVANYIKALAQAFGGQYRSLLGSISEYVHWNRITRAKAEAAQPEDPQQPDTAGEGTAPAGTSCNGTEQQA